MVVVELNKTVKFGEHGVYTIGMSDEQSFYILDDVLPTTTYLLIIFINLFLFFHLHCNFLFHFILLYIFFVFVLDCFDCLELFASDCGIMYIGRVGSTLSSFIMGREEGLLQETPPR